ncbi:MAG: NAD-dependent epimerase/dehydratase family protein [Ruminococcus flavefaciens]|nr:NAD-dependent epimerase/dehydratase family protein [Roseburia sp.]MCM1231432.1 NAD-dependent epimerase/dehydratase family protein [Ruminococcus flavefaciens]
MYLQNELYREDLRIALNTVVNSKELYHKRILITGATGLIGSFAADMLLYANRTEDAEIELYLLARDTKRLRERFISSLDEKRLHFIIQDVVAPLKLDVAVDYIIHAAGDGFPAAFREHPVETMTPALFGTYQLLQYASENALQKFLFLSSGEVYGKFSGIEHDFIESEYGYLNSMSVRSCYPMAKLCAETLGISFMDQYHVPVTIARLSHIYGACTSIHDNHATVQFLQDAVSGKDIILHSAGRQMRSYTYVADCVSAVFTVLLNGRDGEAYNIANAASRVTVADFAHILSQKASVDCIVKAPDAIEKKEHTPIEYAVLDSAKLEQLGWKGKYDIYKGIEKMFDIKMAGREGNYEFR